ncbi:MAG: CerR family C-terminal domain-containing protein [Planctomycetota bacterium]|jgi:AcrR family transcriptional regulator
MSKRKDGIERKAALLDAAMKVFAEKGYRDTTVADICAEAKSNTASVNYYYGSKEELYAEVWRSAFRKSIEKYPPDMGVEADAGPQEQLKGFIQSLLYKMLGRGELGHAGQILLMEVASPTEALECVKDDAIEPMRLHMKAILGQLLGPAATEQQVAFCAMSVVHQCIGFGFKKGKLPPPLREMDRTELRQLLIEHITRFSLAGIAAVKQQIEQSQSGD